MAQRGRKPDPAAVKIARGTMKPNAFVPADPNFDPSDIPVKHDYLSDAAKEVFDRELEHFIRGGAIQLDSAFVNVICSELAEYEAQTALRQSGADGAQPVPVTRSVELRIALGEFGMAGPKSRVPRQGAGQPQGVRPNAFGANGRPPRP